MARKPEISEAWFEAVCETMVLDNVSLRKAAQTHGIALTVIEAENVSRRVGFQACLKRHEYAYFEELGSDPRRTKNVLLGGMYYDIIKLRENGQHKDSLAGSLQLAKVEYNTEGEVSGALGNLTAAEIDEVKKRIRALGENTNKPVEAPNGPIN